MTLIITITTSNYIVQLCDRRLTTKPATGVYDDLANKTIVVHCTNALAVLSYSGVAYVDSTPTDEWIAGLACGSLIGAPRGQRIGLHPGLRDLGAFASRIDRAAKPIERDGELLTFVAAGLQWRGPHRLVVPTLIQRDKKGVRFRIHSGPPKTYEPTVTATPVGWIGEAELEDTRARVSSQMDDPDLLEELALQLLRNASARHQEIGTEFMSVLISRAPAPTARVRFLADGHKASYGLDEVPIWYSPWVISSTQSRSPCFHVGPHTFETYSGSVAAKVHLEFPRRDVIDPASGEPRPRIMAGFSVQPRLGPPTRGPRPVLPAPSFPETPQTPRFDLILRVAAVLQHVAEEDRSRLIAFGYSRTDAQAKEILARLESLNTEEFVAGLSLLVNASGDTK